MPRPINGQFRSLGVIVAVVLSVSAIAQTPGFARPKPPRPPVPTSPENAPPRPEPLNGAVLNPRPSIFNEPTYNRLSGGRRAELPPDRRVRRPGAPPPPGVERPPAPEPRGVRRPGATPPPPGVERPPAPGEQAIPVPPPNTP